MRTILLATIISTAVGCAGQPAPTQQVASALAAVRGAEVAGAKQDPEAALHLKLAQEQIEKARQLMDEGENARAHSLAVRADHDAELAIALVRQKQAEQKLKTFTENRSTSGGTQP